MKAWQDWCFENIPDIEGIKEELKEKFKNETGKEEKIYRAAYAWWNKLNQSIEESPRTILLSQLMRGK